MRNSLMLMRPIDGRGIRRKRRYARLVGILSSRIATRIARELGLSEHDAQLAARASRTIAARHITGLPLPRWTRELGEALVGVATVAEAMILAVDPLDGEAVTPNAALRAMRRDGSLYQPAVEGLQRSFVCRAVAA